jgi:hypothetical protein
MILKEAIGSAKEINLLCIFCYHTDDSNVQKLFSLSERTSKTLECKCGFSKGALCEGSQRCSHYNIPVCYSFHLCKIYLDISS